MHTHEWTQDLAARPRPEGSGTPALQDSAEGTLDELLMVACSHAANGVPGAPVPERLRDAVSLLLELDIDRPATWFAAGVVTGFGFVGPTWPPYPVPAGECSDWRMLGQLTAMAMARPDAIGQFCLERAAATRAALMLPAAMAVVVDVVAQALKCDPIAGLGLVAGIRLSKPEEQRLGELVLTRVNRLLDTDQPLVAHDLCEALLRRDTTPLATEPLARAHLRLGVADRMLGRWEHAGTHLRDADTLGLTDSLVAVGTDVRFETALVGVRLDRVESASPDRGERATTLVARLSPVEEDLREVLRLAPGHPGAAYLLACLALGRDDRDGALTQFERAAASLTGLDEGAELLARCDLWRGLLELENGEPATCGAAARAVVRGIRAGTRVRDIHAADAIETLLVLGAPEAADVIAALVEVPGKARVPADLLEEGLRRYPELIPLASELSRHVPARRRLTFLGVALDLAATHFGDRQVEELLEQADNELVTRGGWHEWADILAGSENLRAVIDRDGAWVDLSILNALARGGLSGRVDHFVEVLLRLAAKGPRTIDLVGFFDDLASEEDPDVIQGLRERWELNLATGHDRVEQCPEGGNHGGRHRQTRVSFVGGADPERRASAGAERILRERGVLDWVDVTWHHPDWGSNWAHKADKIEAEYPVVDAVILMPLVRTNFGRRIRRTAGENGVPWFACTGRGSHAIARSIESTAVWAEGRAS